MVDTNGTRNLALPPHFPGTKERSKCVPSPDVINRMSRIKNKKAQSITATLRDHMERTRRVERNLTCQDTLEPLPVATASANSTNSANLHPQAPTLPTLNPRPQTPTMPATNQSATETILAFVPPALGP